MSTKQKGAKPKGTKKQSTKKQSTRQKGSNQKSTKKKGAGRTKLWIWMVLVVLVLVLCVVLAYLICCLQIDQNTIFADYSVNGVKLKGMTREKAISALNEAYETQYGAASIQVEAAGMVYEVPVKDAISPDTEAIVDKAFEEGHVAIWERGYVFLREKIKPRKVEKTEAPVLSDEAALDTAILSSGLLEVNTTIQTSMEQTEGNLVFTKGVTGVSVDQEGLRNQLKESIVNGDYTTVISCSVITGTVDPVDLNTIAQEMYVEPANAYMDNSYNVVEAVQGVSIDVESAQAMLDEAAEGSVVNVPIVYTDPEYTTAKYNELLFRDKMGTYTTSVSGTSNRINNVQLSANSCNGKILLPGETFSYNDVVGKRTAAAGYKTAAAYSNGDTVQELGGGICQTSSTLYNAVVLANLEITERRNHSYVSGYVPIGRDATVSWGGPDFKFTNNTEFPIKVAASYSGGKLTCSILGTNLTGQYVVFESEKLSETPYGTKYQETPDLPAGITQVSVSGETGYKARSYRKVYDANGNLISSEVEANSTYSKRDQVVLVGTAGQPDGGEPAEGDPNGEQPAEGEAPQ